MGFTLLIDPEGGRAIGIGLFETEEDLRQGDRVLNEMDPPADMGTAADVEVYEVAFEARLDAARDERPRLEHPARTVPSACAAGGRPTRIRATSRAVRNEITDTRSSPATETKQ